MRNFLYLCEWTAPDVIGLHQTRATGQVKLIEDVVLNGRVDGSGWAFPQHRAKPALNGIMVFCPEANYDALIKVAGVRQLHEIPADDAKIASLIGLSAFACVCRNGQPMSRRRMIGMIGLGALAMSVTRLFAPVGTVTASEVNPEDKTALVSFLTAKNYDKDASLSAATKAAWAPTEIAKVIEQEKITDTKMLAYETMKSPLFGWINQTLANVGLT